MLRRLYRDTDAHSDLYFNFSVRLPPWSHEGLDFGMTKVVDREPQGLIPSFKPPGAFLDRRGPLKSQHPPKNVHAGAFMDSLFVPDSALWSRYPIIRISLELTKYRGDPGNHQIVQSFEVCPVPSPG